MADRTCEKCGKRFDLPCHLKRHQARKTACDPIVATPTEAGARHICKHCGRGFASRDSMYRHIRQNCKVAGRDVAAGGPTPRALQQQLDEQKANIAAHAEQKAKIAAHAEQIAKIVAHAEQIAEIVAAPPKAHVARRPDPGQALVRMASGLWEVLPLEAAARLIFDGAANSMARVAMSAEEKRQLPLEAQAALANADQMT